MKKLNVLLSFIFILLILSGCSHKSTQTVKVIVPSGAPTLAFLKMMQDEKKIENFQMSYETVNGPDLLAIAMTQKSHQIVVAPTNLGARLYEKSPDYIYAGTLTLGNLYLVSNVETSVSELENKTICAFGQGGTPEILLRKVLELSQVDNVNIQFLNNVDDAALAFEAGTYQYALLAEPALSVLKYKINEDNQANNENKVVYTLLDVQSVYQENVNSSSYPQAGVFIEKDFALKNPDFVNAFLDKLTDSISYLNTNKEDASYLYQNLELSPTYDPNALVNSIDASNIQFLNASESKPLLIDYFNMIYGFNPVLIGGKLPDDAFYLGS